MSVREESNLSLRPCFDCTYFIEQVIFRTAVGKEGNWKSIAQNGEAQKRHLIKMKEAINELIGAIKNNISNYTSANTASPIQSRATTIPDGTLLEAESGSNVLLRIQLHVQSFFNILSRTQPSD